MGLKCEKKVMVIVDYYDLEEYVKEVTGQEYELPCDMETANDTSLTVDVDGKVDDYSMERVQEFLSTGKYSFLLHSLMNYLCKLGKIEAGEYVINISW